MDTPRKRPRQQRSRFTVDAVLEAAARVFQREGMAATTNRIAERAGFSIGTLYQYFPNKVALLSALAERHIEDAAAALRATFAELDDSRPGWEDTVRALAATLAALHADRPRLHTVLYDLAPRVPDGVARLHALHAETTTSLARHVRRCGVAPVGDGGAGAGEQEQADRTAALLVQTAEVTVHRIVLADTASGAATDDVAAPLAKTLLALVPAPTR
ncbi:AcrR family transcriptional regulator [Prauserella isguenensis]|uniref:AcrR family transcriptional regulator n=1 Tax=Prauserella isguenensis TaxID=1470180 RepID=A0A839S339_9PSEU|nr:TetR/AcrR family transcriptional regulator [Prauserella isguenensis]MBB3052166.1 AcrR family transcriptional regulator [Prauserella isguenensis]